MQVDASPLDVDSQIMYRTIYLKYMTFNLNIHTCIAMPLPCIFGLHLHSSVLSPNFALGLAMMGLLHSYRWGAEQLCQACAGTGREDSHRGERELSKLLGGNCQSSYGLAPIYSQT